MNRLKQMQKLELVLKQEAEDLERLGLGHQAGVVNQEYRHITGHYLHFSAKGKYERQDRV